MNKFIVIIVLIVTQNAYATDHSNSFYLFTSLGKSNFSDMTTQSDISAAKANIISNLENQFILANPGATSPNYSADLNAKDTGTGVGFGIGYIFHKYVSVETSYQYFGSVKVSGQIIDGEDSRLNYAKTGVIGAFDVRTFIHTPSVKGFNGFVNWGAILWSRETRIKYSFVDSESSQKLKDTGFEVVYGLGIQYLSKDHFGAMIAWEEYNIAQENLNIVKATLLYKFKFPI